jgi:glycerol kinase
MPEVRVERSLRPDGRRLFGAEIPLAGIAGDQQAALFGQQAVRPGLAKNTYGTGCFLLLNTGDRPVFSRHRLLTTVAWRMGGRTTYALEGSVFIAGAAVQWLRDGLGLIRSSREIERLAATVSDNGGVYLVPAFAGLGAPHWDRLRARVHQRLTRGSTAGHLARAVLESIAHQSADVLEAMHKDAGARLRELRVDGGACVNDALMQFQADLLGLPVVRPVVTETTALGAAYLAGLAVGFWGRRGAGAALEGGAGLPAAGPPGRAAGRTPAVGEGGGARQELGERVKRRGGGRTAPSSGCARMCHET